jgi:hypothetical protein
MNEDGTQNNDAISYWQRQGGLTAVKAVIRDIHTKANAQGLSDAVRLPYLTKCYGITKINSAPVASSPDLPDSYTCSRNKIIGKLNVTQNFTLSFDIKPTSGAINDWQSIIHFTTGTDDGNFGSRAPGIWFAPSNLNEFAVHVDHSNDVGWACRPSLPSTSPDYLSVGKTTRFILTCINNSITVTIGSTIFSYTHDGRRFEGLVTVYGGDQRWPTANADVSNLSYEIK